MCSFPLNLYVVSETLSHVYFQRDFFLKKFGRIFPKTPGSVFLSSCKLPISSDDNSPSVDMELSEIPTISTLFKTRIRTTAFLGSIYLIASTSNDPSAIPETLNLIMCLRTHNVKIRRIITIASAIIKRIKRLSSELNGLVYVVRESPETTPRPSISWEYKSEGIKKGIPR